MRSTHSSELRNEQLPNVGYFHCCVSIPTKQSKHICMFVSLIIEPFICAQCVITLCLSSLVPRLFSAVQPFERSAEKGLGTRLMLCSLVCPSFMICSWIHSVHTILIARPCYVGVVLNLMFCFLRLSV